MAAPVKVYGPALSTAVARVLACLYEKDVDFELVPVDMSKGEHKKPEFLSIQPFGQVPAFQDDTISIFESRAICRYICDKYPEKGNTSLYGTNPLAKASMEQWLEAESQSFNPPSGALVFQLAFAPRMNIPQDKAAIDKNLEKLDKVLGVYEKQLADSRFLAGDEFSMADLSHLPNAHYLVTATDKGEMVTSRENVGRWWAEISGREISALLCKTGVKGSCAPVSHYFAKQALKALARFCFFFINLCFRDLKRLRINRFTNDVILI